MDKKIKLMIFIIIFASINELACILNMAQSSIREHLWELEEDNKIKRNGKIGRNVLWSIV